MKQKALIDKVCEELGLSHTFASGLLLLMDWNYDKVLNAYLDDPEKLMKEMFNFNQEEADYRLKSLKSEDAIFECPICKD